MRPAGSLTFRPVRERVLPVRGASAVAAVPGGLLVVDDDRGVFRTSGRRATLWAGRDLHPALGDLEGLAVDEENVTAWAVAEGDSTVVALAVADRRPRPVETGRLPRPGKRKKKNKGFEGLAFLPERFSPSSRASLVAVHEGKPRRVAIFSLPDLDQTHEFALPKRAQRLLDDLADVTVDPVTGAFLLLSDESQRIVVLEVADDDELKFAGAYDLPFPRGEKPEGLDFVSPSRLVVVTDATSKVLELAVRRGNKDG